MFLHEVSQGLRFMYCCRVCTQCMFLCVKPAQRERRFLPHNPCLLIHTLWFALPSTNQQGNSPSESLGISLGLSLGTLAAPGVSGLVEVYGHLPKDSRDISYQGLSNERAKLMPEVCLGQFAVSLGAWLRVAVWR